MKAAYYDRQGPARDVLTVGALPDPEPGPGQVRVRIQASGLNPSDTKGRGGWGGMPMPFPRIIPHQDGAGTIDRVGPGVAPDRVGERVWIYEAQRGRAGGTAASFTVVPSTQAVRLPDDISFETGACLGVPAMTAHRCLFADGDLRGRWVLVQGGAGAVGTAAILLARWAGARVIATVSRDAQADIARAAGAEIVVMRRDEDVAARVRDVTDGAGVERIVEVNLVDNIATDLACLAPNGVVSCYASATADARLSMVFREAMVRNVLIRMVFVYGMGDAAHIEAARDITACLAAGAYRPVIGLTLPLDRIAEAHDAQDNGGILGKVVLTGLEA